MNKWWCSLLGQNVSLHNITDKTSANKLLSKPRTKHMCQSERVKKMFQIQVDKWYNLGKFDIGRRVGKVPSIIYRQILRSIG